MSFEGTFQVGNRHGEVVITLGKNEYKIFLDPGAAMRLANKLREHARIALIDDPASTEK